MSHIIAVDIGAAGALAILSADGQLIEVHDMPVLNDGPAGRRAVNPALLAEIVFKSHAAEAFIEFVGARPGEAASGALHRGETAPTAQEPPGETVDSHAFEASLESWNAPKLFV
jgi:crossover junction endodeoxyribonuclease RuvC